MPELDLPQAPSDLTIEAQPETPPAPLPGAGLDPAAIQLAGEQIGGTVVVALDILLPRLGWGGALDVSEQARVVALGVAYARARPRLCIAAAAFTPPELVIGAGLYELIASRAKAAAEEAEKAKNVVGG